ncbi:MAG: thiopurine S-methyltransferase [Moraxellaceae bacterium]|uniref:Thiopurine S-methyltransferase n=1 Tax=Acinetobacter tjernbergiae DSM 14971 = CIP 107465 TaxID=1120928 RepID=V2V9J2_9GAMM|nr:thiopurine S-methyltransferase [Acinetobacter tjernbergiae]ESK57531.1 Se/Te detoxification family thiopurine S-methyltransferase [Acinetobacter tjernbergiae DSM 14971 = CIP 107465]MBH2001061.1 thiopurine S-methyltransferase [Moraxellaceae bacterium]MBH2029151.1 thiopurine S-methyltransferase [Moraxellaceae bacterium]
MQHDFWHDKWQTNNIGFHQDQPHPLLTQHLQSLSLSSSARIFVPLCGKSLDLAWLIKQGYHVVGIDLSPIAIQALIIDLGLSFTETQSGELTHYQHPQIELFVGDFFQLTVKQLGDVDAVYDRAALIALPPQMRSQYTQHLLDITKQAPQLLISLEYDQNLLQGPPFSVPEHELTEHYATHYQIKLLETMTENLKGKVIAHENAWSLSKSPQIN